MFVSAGFLRNDVFVSAMSCVCLCMYFLQKHLFCQTVLFLRTGVLFSVGQCFYLCAHANFVSVAACSFADFNVKALPGIRYEFGMYFVGYFFGLTVTTL